MYFVDGQASGNSRTLTLTRRSIDFEFVHFLCFASHLKSATPELRRRILAVERMHAKHCTGKFKKKTTSCRTVLSSFVGLGMHADLKTDVARSSTAKPRVSETINASSIFFVL